MDFVAFTVLSGVTFAVDGFRDKKKNGNKAQCLLLKVIFWLYCSVRQLTVEREKNDEKEGRVTKGPRQCLSSMLVIVYFKVKKKKPDILLLTRKCCLPPP